MTGTAAVTNDELAARIRAIVHANPYMTLATADEAGRPWATPVWYATDDCRAFFWVSKPEAHHSRNVRARRDVAIVVFDSRVPVGQPEALYMRAEAGEVEPDALDAGIATFSARSREQGAREWARADVEAPAPLRLYRATAVEHWILAPGDERVAVRLP